MRIVMMCDSFLPTCDGVVTSVLTIKEALEKNGHEVIIVAPEPEKEHRLDGVYYFRAIKFRSYKGYYVPIFLTNKIELMKKLKPDVIHVHGVATMAIRALICGRELGIPTVMTFHTMVNDAAKFYMPIKLPPEIADRLITKYLKSLAKRFDVIVTPTECIGNEIQSKGIKFRNHLTVSTGAKTDLFYPGVPSDAIKEKYGLTGHKVVIHVSRISFEKEIEMILRAIVNLDVKFLIVGQGPAEENVRKEIKRLGIEDKVVLTGYVENYELPQYYNAADLAVSASAFETQGLSILEAMASGLPVACRNARQFQEIIKDGENGFLFDNEDSCRSAIEKGLSASKELKDNQYKTAIQNSVEKCVEGYERAYQLAIKTKKERGKKHGTR